MIFDSIFLDSNQDMGYIALAVIFVFFAIGFIWLELIEKPREKRRQKKFRKRRDEAVQQLDIENQKEYELFKSRKSHLLHSKTSLELYVGKLSDNLPSCNKCGDYIFTIWELNNSTLTIRCNGCKKKFIIRNNDIENNYVGELNNCFRLFIELLESPNPYLQKYQEHSYDFLSLRSDFPKYRGIVFESNGEELETIINKIPSDEPSRRISQSIQDRVWRRDEGKCVKCGSREKLEFDHIIPFSKGGSNGYRNIQLLCENCNRTKSNQIG